MYRCTNGKASAQLTVSACSAALGKHGWHCRPWHSSLPQFGAALPVALLHDATPQISYPMTSHTLAVCRPPDATKHDVLRSAASRVVQAVIGTLAAAVASAISAEGSQPTGKLVLPTLTVLLEWWAAHPSYSV